MTLPRGWTFASASDACEIVQSGGTPKEGFIDKPGIPFLKVYNIVDQKVDFDYRPQFVVLDVHKGGLKKSKVLPGDVLMNIVGPPLGKVAIVPTTFTEWNINQALALFRPSPAVTSRWLYYFLSGGSSIHKIINETRGIVGQVNISLSQCRDFELPLPPFAEQHRIVAKLDALMARLARARAELDRVPILAENLRKQVVREAFNGVLTTDFREASRASKAADDEALDGRYSAEIGTPRRKPAADIDWQPSIDLPVSWRWVSIDRIVAEVQYGTSAKTSSDASGVPVLRMGNIQNGKLDWTDLKYLPQDHDEFPDLLLGEGDVLFNRTNSFELVGKTAAFGKIDRPVSFASYLIRVHPFGMPAELLSYYLNSSYARQWIDRVASQQVGQANVNGSKLKALGIPLPPYEEQVEMLERINRAMARADRLEAEAARARALLDRLESAILAKAFRGELVPQDPNDEPASVLLERIRAQRGAEEKPKRARQANAALGKGVNGQDEVRS